VTVPDDSLVLLQRDADIAILTLNNPARRNAFGAPMREVFLRHLLQLEDDTSCRAIVVTGAGGQFCSGGDLSEMRQRPVLEARMRMETPGRIAKMLVSGPKPYIAAAEGNVAGAGLSLLAASDYGVVADNATLSCSFIKVGLIPDVGGLWSIPRRVGRRRAMEILGLGEVLNPDKALEIGLINEIAPPGQVLDRAVAVARRFAKTPPVAMALLRSALSAGADTLDQALNTEMNLQGVLMSTDDFGEASDAFREKRPPAFKGV
jgi:enoyl-CoA hydratase/carnithine racemase